MLKSILSSIYEYFVNRRNRKFQISKIYSSDNFPKSEKYFKVKYNAKVISIGNLSAGGTGKTPLAIEIVNSYIPAGLKVCIIGRNYKAKSIEGNEKEKAGNVIFGIDKNGNRTSSQLIGDEMYLIQSRTNTIAISGPKKYINAAVAEQTFHPDLMIIDDGFQHQWIMRDLDIVIIDKYTLEKPLVFPLGKLREPITSLIRADIIFYPELSDLSAIYKYLKDDALICAFKIIPDKPYPLFDEIQLSDNSPKEINFIPIVGIANPSRFFYTLNELTIKYDRRLAKIFDDHHRYREKDIEHIIEQAKTTHSAIITTEKDAVKISLYKEIFIKNQIEVYIVPIKFKIVSNENEFIQKVNSIF